MDYKNAGVDIEAGYKAVELMKKHIASTMRDEVLTDIGGFSGAFSMEAFKNMEHYTSKGDNEFKDEILNKVFLMKITCKNLSAKSRKK